MEPKTVLVVDDEPDLVETIRFSLERVGYNVLTAYNGFEALGVARSEQPDVVILDVMLPRKNGYEVSRLLREDQVKGSIQKSIKIIILTARKPDSEKSAEFYATWARADEYVYKPFEMDDLVKLVEKHASEREDLKV